MLWKDLDINSSAWDEVRRLKSEMARVFSNIKGPEYSEYPAINILAGQNDYILTAELPGLKEKDIEISAAGDTLTLKGERSFENLKEGAEYHRQERSFGKFMRSIKLSTPVDTNKIDASLKEGVLTIKLPYAESAKQKKITIKSS